MKHCILASPEPDRHPRACRFHRGGRTLYARARRRDPRPGCRDGSAGPVGDRLAAGGLRFTDFHSNGSMCTPTRAAMLTGQYQHRFGRKFDGPLSGEITRDHGLPHEAITIAEVLKKNGYATGMFGKWHLGYIPPWLPTSQGFDEFRGLGSGDGDHHTHIDRWGREDWWHNNQLDMQTGYTADLLTQYSVDFIEQHQDEPFFLYVPHLAIHFPWQGPNDPPHRTKGHDYGDDKWGIIPDPSNVGTHVKAMVESIDKSVGQIMAKLKQLDLHKNTLVIFTSDNGGYLNYGEKYQNISSNGPLRGQKGTLYEGGHRVPMIFLTGCVDADEALTYTHQVFDHGELLKSVTKASIKVVDGAVNVSIDKAIAIALDGQPGPVHVDLPIRLAAKSQPASTMIVRTFPSHTAPAEGTELETARQWLREAQRPLIIAGVDVLNQNAVCVVKEFVRDFGIPLITTYKAKGVTSTNKLETSEGETRSNQSSVPF